jgi:phosphohistidine phosphatase
MKILILVRHAKSSWDHQGLDDMDRPLNEKGKKDAPEMAKRLKDKGLKLDRIISSTAKRARRTARYFAEEFDIKKDDIILTAELYMANRSGFSNTIASIKDKDEVVALFAHNPGITDFVNTLTKVRIDDMPTCGVFAVQAETDNWEKFESAEKSFLFFDYPKNPLP